MIRNEERSLLNKRISNSDMEKFCLIFEEKNISYVCTVSTVNGPSYTYKYTKSSTEQNPFDKDFFDSMDISSISFKSKLCSFKYGADCNNRIIFEGDEKDEQYQYCFTRIDAWLSNLVKLKRIDVVSVGEYMGCFIVFALIALGLTVGYGFLSSVISKSELSTIFSSIFLGVGLLSTIFLYFMAFPPYEIKIGLCKYKKWQAIFYSLLTSCIIPLVIGLAL